MPDGMNAEVSLRLAAFPPELRNLYDELGTLLLESAAQDVEERLWAKMPSYYVGEQYVRLVPFPDHINVQADSILEHREELQGYRLTPKGMLQIYTWQQVPTEVLRKVFSEALSSS